jgi:hypothetical protein
MVSSIDWQRSERNVGKSLFWNKISVLIWIFFKWFLHNLSLSLYLSFPCLTFYFSVKLVVVEDLGFH